MMNGEEIMATLVMEDHDSYQIKNPIAPAGDIGGGRIGFMPWSFMSKQGTVFVINKEHVIFVAEPNDDLLQAYQQQFSEIITPKTNPVLLKS
jgi:hypothetical protein